MSTPFRKRPRWTSIFVPAPTRELQRLDSFFRRAVRQACDEENASGDDRRSSAGTQTERSVNVRVEKRPRIHRLSNWLSKLQLGIEPRLDQSSTDSNLAISLGFAITLGAGGTSGSSHTLAEWYDPTNRELGLKRGLLVTRRSGPHNRN